MKPLFLQIPLTDAIRIPPYAKYMKDIVTNKRKIPNEEISTLLANYSFDGKVPEKLGDPGIPTIYQWILCRKNTGYHATDPKIQTQGAERGRSWIATKHGDRSLESSNAQHTAERDTELYPGSGPSW
jgi:hypothetical protein